MFHYLYAIFWFILYIHIPLIFLFISKHKFRVKDFNEQGIVFTKIDFAMWKFNSTELNAFSKS